MSLKIVRPGAPKPAQQPSLPLVSQPTTKPARPTLKLPQNPSLAPAPRQAYSERYRDPKIHYDPTASGLPATPELDMKPAGQQEPIGPVCQFLLDSGAWSPERAAEAMTEIRDSMDRQSFLMNFGMLWGLKQHGLAALHALQAQDWPLAAERIPGYWRRTRPLK